MYLTKPHFTTCVLSQNVLPLFAEVTGADGLTSDLDIGVQLGHLSSVQWQPWAEFRRSRFSFKGSKDDSFTIKGSIRTGFQVSQSDS